MPWTTIRVLQRIVSMYVEFAELQALRRKPMTMQDWLTKLDALLEASGREVLEHGGSLSEAQSRTSSSATRGFRDDDGPARA